MSSIIMQGGASGTGSMNILAPNTNSTQIITIPDVTGNFIVSTAVSSSVSSVVTNKIAINIGGTIYYLLASTSGA